MSRAMVAFVVAVASLGCGSASMVGEGAPDAAEDRGAPADASPDAPAIEDGGPADAAPLGDGGTAGGAGEGGAGSTATCGDVDLRACTAGRCSLSAPPGTLPSSVTLTLTERAIPPELAADALAGSPWCDLALPVAPARALTLSIALDGAAPSDAALFAVATNAPARLVDASSPNGARVEGLVDASARYGVTRRAAPWAITAALSSEPRASNDLASLLANLSADPIEATYLDGARLFLGSGPRLLVWSGGPPASPAIAPDVVLGQPSLDARIDGVVSSSLYDATVAGVWSDGARLAVSEGNRVLLYDAVPTASFAPADHVLGQASFATDDANAGGLSASSLFGARGLDGDATRLAVADMRNHRVLVWSPPPTINGEAASVVVGQPTFTSNAVNGGATPMYVARGVTLDGPGAFVSSYYSDGVEHVPALTMNAAPDSRPLVPSTCALPSCVAAANGVVRTTGGGLAIADPSDGRVAFFRARPTAPAPMDFALGQPDTSRYVRSLVSASSFLLDGFSPLAIAMRDGTFVAADRSRLLVWDAAPSYTFEPASRVVGQAGFTTNEIGVDYRGISAATLAYPADVAAAGGTIAVADRGNNRVLLYAASSIANGAPAAVVVGQPDATSFVPNLDQRTPSAARLSGPAGVALDGTHLVVADTENHRVLVWNTVPTTSGAPADLVLGQADFASRRPNHGRGDANLDGYSDADADGFFQPMGVASDGTRLFVADRVNHRVLVWRAWPTRNGQPADAVIGQPDFTSVVANRGAGPFAVSPSGLNLPTGVAIDGGSLWIADTENNRVVRWDGVDGGAPAPALFLGQADGKTLPNPNVVGPPAANAGYPQPQATTASSVLRPRGVARVGARVYVSETDSHRVHAFDAATGAPAGVLGQASDTAAGSNASGAIGPSSLAAPLGLGSDGATLFVADTGNHRVLGFAAVPPPSTGAAATLVLGQASFLDAGFDRALPASAGGTAHPRGVAIVGGDLYVAEADHHRVVVLDPANPGAPPKRIYGQPDPSRVGENAGGAPSARSLRAPHAIWADATHLFVADTGNHRVLMFDPSSPSPDAVRVFGQADFTRAEPNAGGASAATMRAPEGVAFDGARLFVADTGNHRVLVWTALPTGDGAPADRILGQAAANDVASNRGSATPTAATLASPAAVDVATGAIFVADTGNDRVLRWDALPATDGAPASGVLGQPDASSRLAASVPTDLTRLAGPTALADDGARLYVVDRDLGRVVSFLLPTSGAALPADEAYGGARLPLSAPGGIAVERTPLFTSRLYVADTQASRVVVVSSVGRLAGE